MRDTLILLALFFIFLTSCEKNRRYPGYKKAGDRLYYKLHTFGEGKDSISSPYVKGRFVFQDSTGRTIQQISSLEPVSTGKGKYFERVFDELVVGDSVSFVFDSVPVPLNELLPKPIPGLKSRIISPVFLHMKVRDRMSEETYHQFLHHREMEEQKLLRKYLRKQGIDSSHYFRGIHLIPIEKGKGKKVKQGSVVYMHYKGKFLDHSAFDSTYHMKEPFEFTFGTPGQVIDGLELGISKLRGGDKAKIIIPSQLAFGEEGSSTGIVPPFTTVIYQVELKKVR